MRDSTHIQVRICMQQPTVCIPHSRHRIPGCVSVTGAAWFLSEVFCLSPWIYLCCQAVDVATTRITCCTARDHSLFPGEKTWKIEAAPPPRRRSRGSRWRPSTACSACFPLFHLAQQRFSGEGRNPEGGFARSKLCNVTGFLIWSPIEAPFFLLFFFLHLTSGSALLPDDLFFFSCG